MNERLLFQMSDIVPGIPDGVMGIPPNCRNGTMLNDPSVRG